jgi:hypothetical protein
MVYSLERIAPGGIGSFSAFSGEPVETPWLRHFHQGGAFRGALYSGTRHASHRGTLFLARSLYPLQLLQEMKITVETVRAELGETVRYAAQCFLKGEHNAFLQSQGHHVLGMGAQQGILIGSADVFNGGSPIRVNDG